ncbi:cytochrome P450 [Solwaraspora sp. WMMD791]|uniref:cytochrome P450 n=1 Tax=Solwaraspora sp. WMMD791 TaxID=3016086 RepID=UPI00249C88E8|nr:cytochrome P450 [Solwaraspora sp. WMMD791]WFE28287.1 cytochrome P450 [Solwaraspora sp. WMMD791]
MATNRPPGPRGHWLTGNIRPYEADRIGFLRRCHTEYGDVFSFDERTVCVIDPVVAHDVLARTGGDFVTELAPFDGPPDLEFAAASGREWTPARRAARAGLVGQATTTTDIRTAQILDQVLTATGGHEVDVLDVMRGFAARSIADHCLGADAGDVPRTLADAIAATAPFETASYTPPAWLPTARRRRFRHAHRRFTDTLTAVVAQRRTAGDRRPGGPGAVEPGAAADLLDVLLAADPTPPDHLVVSTLRTVLIGGYGVPAAALTSIVRELALRQWLVDRLRADARRADSGLAGAVVAEALRLYPPAWLLTRTARRDTTVGRWSVRAGDEVLLNAYLIHRDPRWWPRPEEFDPDRWLAGGAAPGLAYLPFGAGPRVCLGTMLTRRQLAVVTSRLAGRFTIASPNAASVGPAFAGRLAPAGLRARFTT